VQRAAPDARVVKCFKRSPPARWSDAGTPPTCSSRALTAAKVTVPEILRWSRWLGAVDGAAVEPLPLLWAVVGVRRGALATPFKLLIG
jgi:hypothetical protein